MLDSQRLAPHRLVGEGFPFAYPELDQALRHLLAANEPSRWRSTGIWRRTCSNTQRT
jgi:hypothetical protein